MKKKFFIFIILAVFLLAFCFSSCSKKDETEQESNPGQYDYNMIDISLVIDGIYPNLEISRLTSGSVSKITDKTVLEEQFYLDLENVVDYDVRSADGKFGIADVAIIHAKEGFAREIMDSLEMRKDDRINEFLNYDVYDSYSIAMNGEIYQSGELVIMLLLSEDDKITAKEIIDHYLP